MSISPELGLLLVLVSITGDVVGLAILIWFMVRHDRLVFLILQYETLVKRMFEQADIEIRTLSTLNTTVAAITNLESVKRSIEEAFAKLQRESSGIRIDNSKVDFGHDMVGGDVTKRDDAKS